MWVDCNVKNETFPIFVGGLYKSVDNLFELFRYGWTVDLFLFKVLKNKKNYTIL